MSEILFGNDQLELLVLLEVLPGTTRPSAAVYIFLQKRFLILNRRCMRLLLFSVFNGTVTASPLSELAA